MTEFNFTTFGKKSPNGKKGAPVKYDWLRAMEVGQAYPIPTDVTLSSFRTLVCNYGMQTGKKFSVRKSDGLVGRIA